jgi:hypothetical protein
MPGLPVAANDPAVAALQAHADLQRVSPDLAVNQRLIAIGFDRVGVIADAPREEFVRKTSGVLGGDLKAATLHVNSLAQTALLDGAIADAVARRATTARKSDHDSDLFDDHCCCPDCLTAMGPLAYLADLVQFALSHIRINNEPWSVSAMCDYLGQPFHRLAVTCAAVDGRVRQVRIAVEILRGLLRRLPLTQAHRDQIAAAEREHVGTAYEAVLLRIGTTLEEVRLARAPGADPARREPLAERLGIPVARLDQFFLDGTNLTEPKLEELFGLVDVAADFAAQRAAVGANFAAAVAAVFPAGTDIAALRTQLAAPATAAAALQTVRQTLRLTPEAFLRLAELSDKSAAGPLTDPERDEAADILT